jgi:hypothetical protein
MRCSVDSRTCDGRSCERDQGGACQQRRSRRSIRIPIRDSSRGPSSMRSDAWQIPAADRKCGAGGVELLATGRTFLWMDVAEAARAEQVACRTQRGEHMVRDQRSACSAHTLKPCRCLLTDRTLEATPACAPLTGIRRTRTPSRHRRTRLTADSGVSLSERMGADQCQLRPPRRNTECTGHNGK